MDNSSRQNKMAVMPMNKLLLTMSVPLMMSLLIQSLYNIADSMFVAGYSEQALTATTLVYPVQFLMIAVGVGTAVGLNALLSRRIGQKRQEDACRAATTGLFLVLLEALVFALVGIFGKQQAAALLTDDPSLQADCLSYLSINLVWCWGLFLQTYAQRLLQAVGDTVLSMVSLIIGALVNIVLDPILIFSAGMGAGGAALATLISNAAGDALFFIVICKKARHITILPGRARITAHAFWEILSIGIPASLTNIMQSLAVLLTNRLLLPYGTDQVAAYGIAMKVNLICTLIMVGAAFGAQPLLGYSYGAGAEKRLSALIRFDILTELVISAVFVMVSFGAAPAVVRLFMKDPAIVSAGTAILRAAMISQPAVGVVLVCTTLFQAEGRALPAFVLSLARQGFVLWICLAVFSRAAGLPGILYSQALSDGLTLLVSLAFLRGSGRRRTKIPEAQ